MSAAEHPGSELPGGTRPNTREPPVLADHNDSEASARRRRTGLSSRAGSEGLLLQHLSARPLVLADDSRFPAPDWPGVVALAASHAVTPLLYARLKQQAPQAILTTDVRETLRRAYTASAVSSMRIHGGLRTALRCLRDAGVPVIVLKGAYLAEAVYADPALRPMVDVDLLVPKADLPRAQAALLDIGGTHRQFEDIEASCDLKRHIPQISLRGLVVEIHWTIASPAGSVRVDVGGLWRRACPAAVAGVEVQTLSPEDLLLHICLHACYQERLSSGLGPFCDIAETTRRFGRGIDWTHVSARAREWGAARHVGLTLLLARTMLAADVPDAVLAQLVPGGVDDSVLAAARQAVLARTGYGQWLPFFEAAHTATAADRARLSWRRVFLSRDEMALVYPGPRNGRPLPLYYARRVGHVLRSYATHTLWRRWLKTTRGRGPQAALAAWLSGRD